MRTRTRGGYTVNAVNGSAKQTAIWHPTSGSPSAPQTWINRTFSHPTYTVGQSETFIDLVPFKDGGPSDEDIAAWYGFTFKGQKVTKPMQQVKGGLVRYSPITRSYTTDWPGAGGFWRITYECTNMPIPYTVITPYGLTTDYDSAAFQIVGRNMLHRMRPPTKSGSDLFVFLAEARELPRLLRLLMIKIRKWSDIPDVAHSTNLGTQFGFRPLVNEVKEFLITLDDFQSRYNDLRKQEGELIRKSDRKVEQGEVYEDPEWTYFADGAYRAKAETVISGLTLRAFGRFSYLLPELPGGMLKTDTWLRQLGLNPTPRKIWNLIPWSFVFDWFFNFSKVLAVFERDGLDVSTRDAGFWWKFAAERTTRTEQWTGSSVGYVPHDSQAVIQRVESFNRIPAAIPSHPIPANLLGSPDLQKALSLWSLLRK